MGEGLGNIITKSYEYRILPLIYGIIRLTRECGDPELMIKHDGARSFRNILTLEELQNRGLYVIN